MPTEIQRTERIIAESISRFYPHFVLADQWANVFTKIDEHFDQTEFFAIALKNVHHSATIT